MKSKTLNSTLIFLMITSLTWFSDYSLWDAIILPRIAVFSSFCLIFVVLNFPRIRRFLFTYSWLIPILILFSIPVLTGIPYVDYFYGESQRINGTIQLILIASSIVIGFYCAKYDLFQILRNSLTLNGTAVSIVIIISQFIDLDSPLLLPWAMGNQEGGINENFKSMFVALSLLMLQVKLKTRRRDGIKLYWYIGSSLIHVVALIWIGSLQGFLLIALTGLILACAFKPILRIGIPLFASGFIIVYLSFLFVSPLAQIADSSTRERINLAKRAIELLSDAPLVRPNPIRISENDFSDITLTKVSGSQVWIDDVHNVYLNLGNTIGIFFFVGLAIGFILFLIDIARNIQSLSKNTRTLGAITLATLLVLCITIVNPIYFLPFSLMIGLYLYLREQDLKETSMSHKLDSTKESPSSMVSSKSMGLVISALLAFQLSFAALLILREYSTQRDINTSMSISGSKGKTSFDRNFEHLEPLLERSRDLRFIYEVGRSYYLQGNCAETAKVEMILRERSSNHFLTKKLGSLYDECVTR